MNVLNVQRKRRWGREGVQVCLHLPIQIFKHAVAKALNINLDFTSAQCPKQKLKHKLCIVLQ